MLVIRSSFGDLGRDWMGLKAGSVQVVGLSARAGLIVMEYDWNYFFREAVQRHARSVFDLIE